VRERKERERKGGRGGGVGKREDGAKVGWTRVTFPGHSSDLLLPTRPTSFSFYHLPIVHSIMNS
jgi:hypothetical protein